MAASEALSVQGESAATAADTTAVPGPSAASQRGPLLIPMAQVVAVVLGVFAIIWNQQQSIDNLRVELRTELTAEINQLRTELTAQINDVETGLDQLRTELTAEINQLETGLDELRTEINELETRLRTELGGAIEELRAEVSNNGQRLARIEGFLGIDIPDDPPQ